MNRDGTLHSLWQDTTPDFNARSSNNSNKKQFDVIIAGAGMTGITTGLMLQKQGKSVLIAEAQTLGFGTTGGTTAHLNTFLDTSYDTIQKKFGENDARMVAQATKDAIDLIKKNIEEYKIECEFRELPGFLFSQDEKQTKDLEQIYNASRESGVEVEWSTSIPVPIPFEKALCFPGQALFHPMRYLVALAQAFEEAGGIILQNCRVTSLDEGETHTIHTTNGDFTASHFIYATHIPPGVNLLHFRCAPYRSYALAVELDNDADYPDALVYDMYDPYHYYRSQSIDGKLYFIGGGEDHKTGHEQNTELCLRRLEAHLNKYFPVKNVVNRWSSQYFDSTDGLAYIGHLPGHNEQVYVATGFGGNGMIYSHITAMMLCKWLVTGEHELIELFDPNRIKPVAGFNNFVKESADVVGKLINKILPVSKLSSLSDLAAGEARIVNYEGSRLAIYKDQDGEIHALHSACTHIKCDVSWNNAEKTWDCPCHGSRFSYTGVMLTAPARKDLEKIGIEESVTHK